MKPPRRPVLVRLKHRLRVVRERELLGAEGGASGVATALARSPMKPGPARTGLVIAAVALAEDAPFPEPVSVARPDVEAATLVGVPHAAPGEPEPRNTQARPTPGATRERP